MIRTKANKPTNKNIQTNYENALFAAGCFWSIEHQFRNTKGVTNAICGYSGGKTENPTYEDVCTGKTLHAECVLVTYNTQEISFEKLTHVFFSLHDPTQKNKQGYDIGTQYRSAIFYYTESQYQIANAVLQNYQKKLQTPIVTEITAAQTFYEAEEYHQNYFAKKQSPI